MHTPPPSIAPPFESRVDAHLHRIYPNLGAEAIRSKITELFPASEATPDIEPWNSGDHFVITYGDSIVQHNEAGNEKPLKTLKRFLEDFVRTDDSIIHVLPFFPYSSDDGFAVIDFETVNPELGDWADIRAITESNDLMVDLVINHVSSEHEWFQQFQRGEAPGADYFHVVSEDTDLSDVVRPRATPLLRPTETVNGLKWVWCTFGHDQIDLNYSNPAVLIEILGVLKKYLDQGARVIRLDAVGFLWKEPGTSCMHLPQTHEVVKLIRTVVDHYAPGTMLISETNVPNHENLSYFGNRNEAHVIYNFSLAPLVTHALLSGHSAYLKRWMRSMPPAPVGCTYLNFTASHDGIGMRPAEGLLSDEEQMELVRTVERFGGQVSTRKTADGERVYELNICLFDAFKGTFAGPDDWQFERFLCSQTIMMGLEGIPAFYIHSLLATRNDLKGVEKTGRKRSINRHRWNDEELRKRLANPESIQSRVLRELCRRIRLRSNQPAFDPSATQFTLILQSGLFGFWRQSTDRQQSIFAVHNITAEPIELTLDDLNLISTDRWWDLLTGDEVTAIYGSIPIKPYQCLWLTNHLHDAQTSA